MKPWASILRSRTSVTLETQIKQEDLENSTWWLNLGTWRSEPGNPLNEEAFNLDYIQFITVKLLCQFHYQDSLNGFELQGRNGTQAVNAWRMRRTLTKEPWVIWKIFTWNVLCLLCLILLLFLCAIKSPPTNGKPMNEESPKCPVLSTALLSSYKLNFVL